MQIKIFSIPMIDSIEVQIELNQFLRSHRVVDVRKELGVQNGNHYWTFCITYLDDAKPLKWGQRRLIISKCSMLLRLSVSLRCVGFVKI